MCVKSFVEFEGEFLGFVLVKERGRRGSSKKKGGNAAPKEQTQAGKRWLERAQRRAASPATTRTQIEPVIAL